MTSRESELAHHYGIATEYTGLDGTTHFVPEQTLLAVLMAMGVDPETAHLTDIPVTREAREGCSYHCYLPDWLEKGRAWGISLQVYAIRSEQNWGIGDFRDLGRLARIFAGHGADFVGTNPLHALFLSDPERRSPFFPSNRRFLNPIYIAVDAVPGYTVSEGELAAAVELRRGELVDYAGVTSLKLAALERVWPLWEKAADTPSDYSKEAFAAFCRAGGESLKRHCLFEALSLQMAAEGRPSGWESWPEEFSSPSAPGSVAFAASEGGAINFMLWLQWLASVQLRQAHQMACDAGMRIGLYLDFAVGEAPDGSATWSDAVITMRGVNVGAPPDYFSSNGQNWGLAPLSPVALVARDLTPYMDLVCASMSYGGALRIDHVMSIKQLFLVPEGQPASVGTYIRYPLERMLETLSAASHQQQAVLIGEDLGNVPEGFRDLMDEAAILSYRIFYFEQDNGGFVAAEAYPRNAIACLSTHDLPTIEGWWRGDDVELRRQHGLIDDEAAAEQGQQRDTERSRVLQLLIGANLLLPEETEAIENALIANASLPTALVQALHRFLARTPCRLMAVRLEDVVGGTFQVNLPGTVNTYPNWQRKLERGLEEISSSPAFAAITRYVSLERPRLPPSAQ